MPNVQASLRDAEARRRLTQHWKCWAKINRPCRDEKRRPLPTWLLLLVAAALQGCAASVGGPAAGADWPMFRGGPARLGGDVAGMLPDKPPSVEWVFQEAKPVTFWSSPLVSGGRLYVGGGILSPFGTRGDVYCLALAKKTPGTGTNFAKEREISASPQVLWKHKVDKLVFSSPSLAGNHLLCGEGTHTDTGAALYAFKADSAAPGGELFWTFKVPGTVEASPCIAAGRVYFGTADDFYCLDLATGRQLWKATVIDVLSSPVVAGGMVYVGSGRSEQARPENRSLPGQQLLAFDAVSGELRWRQPLRYACSSPITYVDGKIVAGSGKGTFIPTGPRGGGEVICHDARTGRQLWSRELPDNVLAAIPVEGGRVHVACRDGKYYLLSLADGSIQWEYKCDGPLLASPIVAGGPGSGGGPRVLLLSCNGMAHCLDVAAQKPLWKLDLPKEAGIGRTTEAYGSPVLSGGRIYVGLGSRGLICLRP